MVVHYGARYEGILRRNFGGEATTFALSIENCRVHLGPSLTQLLFEFKRDRNDFSHNDTTNTLRDVRSFVRRINQIEYHLSRIVSSFDPELLTEKDMEQDVPSVEVVYPPAAGLPRLVTWGLSAMAVAFVAALLFGGFTSTSSFTYYTGGIFGFFRDAHHEVHEVPSVLFWVIVTVAGVVAISYVFNKCSSKGDAKKEGSDS